MHALTTLSLRDWLATLDEPGAQARELLLGGTGHLLLDRAEEEAVARQLRLSILPKLFGNGAQRPVCLLTGLAPGGDLLFTSVVSDWLRKAGIPYRVIGLLPLPADDLLADWALAEQGAGREVNDSQSNEQGTRIVDTLRTCSTLVDLLPPGAGAGRLYTAAFRGEQYRRLGACLAERSEILVAILRPGTSIKPGGTAEVVAWRRQPRDVPNEYGTWSRGSAAHPPRDSARELIVIDPQAEVQLLFGETANPYSLKTLYTDRAEAARRDGNYLLCYDIAERALTHGAHAPRLHYLLLLALANVGSTELALRRYEALGLRGDEQDEDWLALEGRLLKDLAWLTGEPQDFLRSAEAYMAAFERTGGYFSSVNAATMFFFAGDTSRALALANLVLALIAATEIKDEFQRYFVRASEAEAALLLGDAARCRQCLIAANACAREDVNARNRTRRQIRAIAEKRGIADDFSELLRLPEVLLFETQKTGESTLGPMLDEQRYRGASAFVALKQPVDLDFVGRVQARGGHTHIVLAEERAVIIERWRRRHGALEAMRLAHALERADEIVVARGFMIDESDWAEQHSRTVARGLADLHAARLGCAVSDAAGQQQTSPEVGTNTSATPQHDFDVDNMAKRLSTLTEPAGKRSQKSGPGRRLSGLIFADIVGFRRLGDHELPRFWSVVMASIARLLAEFGARVQSSNTWGDALHVVTVDALTAAELAVAIQAQFEKIRAEETDSLSRIELRLSAHFGPVFVGHDPVERRAMFYGSQLALTARIEPVTPPGMNFVTEIFAAQLTLEAPQKFRLDYAGELALAKRHGRHRLYNLRPTNS